VCVCVCVCVIGSGVGYWNSDIFDTGVIILTAFIKNRLHPALG